MKKKATRVNIAWFVVALMLGLAAPPLEATTITAPGTYVVQRYTISYVNAGELKFLETAGGANIVRDAAGGDIQFGSGQYAVTWIKFAVPTLAPGLELEAATLDVGGQISSYNGVYTPSIVVGWVADYTHAGLAWAGTNAASDFKTLRDASNSGVSPDTTRYSANIMDWLRKPGEGPGTDLCVLQTWVGVGARGWLEDLSKLGTAGNTNVTTITLKVRANPITAPGTYVISRDTISYVNAAGTKYLDVANGTPIRDGAGRDVIFGSGLDVVTWIKFAIPALAPGLELEAATIDIGGQVKLLNDNRMPVIMVGWVDDYTHADLTWASSNAASGHKALREISNATGNPDTTRYSVSVMDWLRKPGEGAGTNLCVLQTWFGGADRGWMEELSKLGTAGNTNVTTLTLKVRANPITAPGTYVIPRYTISYVNNTDYKLLDEYFVFATPSGSLIPDGGGYSSLFVTATPMVTWIKFAIPALKPGLEIKAATLGIGGKITSYNGVFTPGIVAGWVADYTHAGLTWASSSAATDLKTLRAQDVGGDTDTTRYSANIADWLRKPGEGPGTDLCVLQTWSGPGARGWSEGLSYLGMAGNTNVTTVTLSVGTIAGSVFAIH